jgi:hypothetical protein
MQDATAVWLDLQLGARVPSSQYFDQRSNFVYQSSLKRLLSCKHFSAECPLVIFQLIPPLSFYIFDEFKMCLFAELSQVLLTGGTEVFVG